MKKLLFSIVLTIGLGTAVAQEAAGVKFGSDMTAALEKAKTENKPVFIDIFASWCGYCKQMDAKVFSQETVGDYMNANLVNVRIDGDKGDGKSLAAKYRIRGYPTFIILDCNGNELGRIAGAVLDPGDFVRRVKAIVPQAK